ncbi:pyrroloquinoline quinone biosynthesis protein PqqB [Ruegeria pomeroyi]|uniref:Coenzyme PQQ synthesis protein B n=1 Tax=Ruegeria pomeroyi TaxID=89184 RepID=A0A9Q3WKC8_9RHOB|nr:pyrroloquinoline quinone biosynthesis protein PqqB [Ruegeria pomeroyi]MCE8536982.1 pyrroloquinoline quinone biosynthesis protein PqqB [Ruegeria pomeroyi]
MKIVVLGAAAGGGLPQWNCGCVNCNDARAGRLRSSGQSSLAVSADGSHWSILNASPDIRQQMQDRPVLHPHGLRGSPVASVLVTNGDIDHIAGLLSLREQTPFDLFATAGIHEVLEGNRIFDALARDKVARRRVALDTPFALQGGLQAMLFAVPGKVPLFMEGETVDTGLIGEQTVGVRLSDGQSTAYYIPGCAHVPDDLLDRLSDADHLLFDGTLWDDDEMIRSGTGIKTGRRMGHIPISGDDGSLLRLAGLTAGKTYIHINNTNPVWREDSAERAEVARQGWQVAHDGLEIVL